MSIFDLFRTAKEINDELIKTRQENKQLKEKIAAFDNSFKEIVSDLIQKNHDIEKRQVEEISDLKAEIKMLKERFNMVTEKAILQTVASSEISPIRKNFVSEISNQTNKKLQ